MQQQWKGLVAAASLAILAGCSTTTGGSGDSQIEGGSSSSEIIGGGEGITSGIDQGQGLEGGMSSGVYGESGLSPVEHSLLEQKVYRFEYNSSQIKPNDLAALDAHAKYLSSPAGQNQSVLVQGHTDERGAREYNLALGERRANAVKQYLELRGVQAQQIEVVSYGEERPLNPSSSAEAWSENRRAVLVPANSRYGQ